MREVVRKITAAAVENKEIVLTAEECRALLCYIEIVERQIDNNPYDEVYEDGNDKREYISNNNQVNESIS